MENSQLTRCIHIVEKLLDPQDGCPWDLKQTHQSLLKYLIEESYEFIHATESQEVSKMEEELGDILLQILLHAGIAGKNQKFSLESVAKTLAEKLIYRHPHIFKEKNSKLSADDVLQNWNQLKEQKKKDEGTMESYKIDSSFLCFPALFASNKIGKKTNQLSFDWNNYAQVIYKVEEEWQELKEELPPSGEYNKERVKEELGDLLFSIAQLARHLDVDPEDALRSSNKKFIERFNIMEDMLREKKLNLENLQEEQKDSYWIKAKIRQKEAKKN